MRDDEKEIYNSVWKAIKEGNLAEVVQLLGADRSWLQMETPFGPWLHIAATYGTLDIVRWLVSQGADVNVVGGIANRRAIDQAASAGHVDIVKFLIDSGATLDASKLGLNPLFAAIVGGILESHTAVAKLLIDSGLDTTVLFDQVRSEPRQSHHSRHVPCRACKSLNDRASVSGPD